MLMSRISFKTNRIVTGMIEEADFKKNGQVDYDEFLQLMFQSPETGLEAAGNVRK